MTGLSPKVFVSRRLPDLIEERMGALFDCRFIGEDVPQNPNALIEQSRDCDVLVSTITDKLDASVIEHLGDDIRLIAQFGNGVDNIDINAAAARGITVTNTPSVLTDDTADMAMALILSVPRRLIEGSQTLVKRWHLARLVTKLDAWPSIGRQATWHCGPWSNWHGGCPSRPRLWARNPLLRSLPQTSSG